MNQSLFVLVLVFCSVYSTAALTCGAAGISKFHCEHGYQHTQLTASGGSSKFYSWSVASATPASIGSANFAAPDAASTSVQYMTSTCFQSVTFEVRNAGESCQVTIFAGDDVVEFNKPAGFQDSLSVTCGDVPPPADLSYSSSCYDHSALTYSFSDTEASSPYFFTRRWQVVSACGVEVTAAQDINVEDNEAPWFDTESSYLHLQCGEEVPDCEEPLAFDKCDEFVTVTKEFEDLSSGPRHCDRKERTTWTAIDDKGNTATISRTVTWSDDQKPTLHISQVAEEITVPCHAVLPAVTATAQDNCDDVALVPTITSSRQDGLCLHNYTMIYDITVEDVCGNRAHETRRVNVIDNIAPAITEVERRVTLKQLVLPEPCEVEITDNCDDASLTIDTTLVEDEACSKKWIRTWTAMDDCGNVATRTQEIIWNDVNSYELTEVPSELNVECADEIPEYQVYAYNPDDQVSTLVQPTDSADCSEQCECTFVRTWAVNDNCHGVISQSQTIHISRPAGGEADPQFIGGSGAQLSGECDFPPVPTMAVRAGCDWLSANTQHTIQNEVFDGCEGSRQIVYEAIDDCGNRAVKTISQDYKDTISPVIMFGPSDFNTELTSDMLNDDGEINLSYFENLEHEMTVDDDCQTANLWLESSSYEGEICDFVVTLTWKADDGCGNTASHTQKIGVKDTSAPLLVVPIAGHNTECPADPSFTGGSFNDVTEIQYTVETTSSTTIEPHCQVVVTQTLTATDACGHSSSTSAQSTVTDTSAPTLTNPHGNDREFTHRFEFDNFSAELVANGLPATDDCGTVTVTTTYTDSDDCDTDFTRTFHVVAEDECGYMDSLSFPIKLVDDTSPALDGSGPANLVGTCGTELQSLYDSWSAVEWTDESEQVTNGDSDVLVYQECPDRLQRVYTWWATDCANNRGEHQATITISNPHGPTLQGVPANDLYVPCGDEDHAVPDVVAVAHCNPDPVPVTPTITAGDDCGAPTVYKWEFADDCGLSTSAQWAVKVVDSQAPSFTVQPDDTTFECDLSLSNATRAPTPAPEINDDCTTPSLSSSASLDDQDNCKAEYTWTYEAVDQCGNRATITATTTIEDTIAPTLHVPGYEENQNYQCIADVPAPPQCTVAHDQCAGGLTCNYLENQDTTTLNGRAAVSITRTYSATDGCHSVQQAETILVQDTIPPVLIRFENNQTQVECDIDNPWTVPPPQVEWEDNCGATETWFVDKESITDGCNQILVREYCARDQSNLETCVTFTRRIVDTTPPTFGDGDSLEASDNCGLLSVDCNSVETTDCTGFTNETTCTATDLCGLSTDKTVTVFLPDTIPPTFNPTPADGTYQCFNEYPAPLEYPIGGDIHNSLTETSVSPTTIGCQQQVTYTYSIYDCGLNLNQAVQQHTFVDTDRPTLNVMDGQDIDCTAWLTNPDTESYVPSVTFSDSCLTTEQLSQTYSHTQSVLLASANDVLPNIENLWGQITYQHQITDHCHDVTDSSTVNIIDDEDPTVTVTQSEVDHECGTENPLDIFENYFTSDDQCGLKSSHFESSTNQGGCPCAVDTTITLTAEDWAGNSDSDTIIFRTRDTLKPYWTTNPLPPTLLIFSSEEDVPDQAIMTAADVHDASAVTVTSDESRIHVGSSNGQDYMLHRTWEACDACGNCIDYEQKIYVIIDSDPIYREECGYDITNLDTLGASIRSELEAEHPGSTAAYNGYSSEFPPQEVQIDCKSSYRLSFVVTLPDSTSLQKYAYVVVEDTQPPVIHLDSLEDHYQCAAPPAQATAEDCSNYQLTHVDSGVEYITRTYTAVDECGHIAIAEQHFRVKDTIPPEIANVASCTSGKLCGEICDLPGLPEVSDNCPGVGEPAFSGSTGTPCTTTSYPWKACVTDATGLESCVDFDRIAGQNYGWSHSDGPQDGHSETLDCEDVDDFQHPTSSYIDQCGALAGQAQAYDWVCDSNVAFGTTTTCQATLFPTCLDPVSATLTFDVTDTENPFVDAGLDETVQCYESRRSITPASVGDNCDPAPVVQTTVVTVDEGIEVCPYDDTLETTFTVEDWAHLSSSDSYQSVMEVADLTWTPQHNDATAECHEVPDFLLPRQYLEPCTGLTHLSGVGDVSQNEKACPPDSDKCVRVVEYAWSAVDPSGCDRSLTATHDMIVLDTVAPSLLTDHQTFECAEYSSTLSNKPMSEWIAFLAGQRTLDDYLVLAEDLCADPEVHLNMGPLECTPDESVLSAAGSVVATDPSENTASNAVTLDIGVSHSTNSPGSFAFTCYEDMEITSPTYTQCGVTNDMTLSGSLPSTCGDFPVTYTAPTLCGDVSETVHVSIEDNVPPAWIGLPPDSEGECGDANDLIRFNLWKDAIAGATATDNCDSVTFDVDPANTFGSTCDRTTKYTGSAQDFCGSSTPFERSFTFRDSQPPVLPSSLISVPQTHQCADDVPPIKDVSNLSAADQCEGPKAISASASYTEDQWVYTYQACDSCGNCDQIVEVHNIDDTIPPTVDAGADLFLNCDDTHIEPTVTAEDNCDGSTVIFPSTYSEGDSCQSSITYSYSYTDNSGNTDSDSRTVTYSDNDAPNWIVTGTDQINLECGMTDWADILALTNPQASDNCNDHSVSWSWDEVNLPQHVGTCSDRTYTAEDVCSNAAHWTQQVCVVDTIPPAVIGREATFDCDNENIPDNLYPFVNDLCDHELGPEDACTLLDQDIEVSGCATHYTQHWNCCDEYDNCSPGTTKKIVVDTRAPVVTQEPTLYTGEIDCSSDWATTAAAVDACTDDLTEEFSVTTNPTPAPTDGSTYTVARSWTWTDWCGQQTTRNDSFSVVDSTAPTITPLNSLPHQLDIADWYHFTIPTGDSEYNVNDDCDEDPEVEYPNPEIEELECIHNFLVKVTVRAVDASGNAASVIRTFVVDDNIKPIIHNVPNDVDLTYPSEPDLSALAHVYATDNSDSVDLTVDVDVNDDPDEDNVRKIITYTWTARDPCGNEETAQWLIKLIDDQPCIWTFEPEPSISVQCLDEVPDPCPMQCVPEDGEDFDVIYSEWQEAPGMYKRQWTALDSLNNEASFTQTILIADTTDPVFSEIPSSNIDHECDCNEWIPPTITAVDNCDGEVAVDASYDSNTKTWTWTASDSSGNTVSTQTIVNVIDTTDPVLLASGDALPASISCEAITDYDLFDYENSFVPGDSCEADRNALDFSYNKVHTYPSDTCRTRFTISHTWTVTDSSGNSFTRHVGQNIYDDQTPQMTATSDICIYNIQESAVTLALDELFQAHDNCAETVEVLPSHCNSTGFDADGLNQGNSWSSQCHHSGDSIVLSPSPTDGIHSYTITAALSDGCQEIPASRRIVFAQNFDDFAKHHMSNCHIIKPHTEFE